MHFRTLSVAATAFFLANCAGKPVPAPGAAPPVRPAPPVAEAPPPPAEQGPHDTPDPPLSPGDWSFEDESSGSVARFGTAGTGSFSLRCDPGRRRIVLARQGAGGGLRVATSYGQRALAAPAELPADDPLLDEIAFSRGRFTVESAGLPPLILPAWPEPARVIDDCRGG